MSRQAIFGRPATLWRAAVAHNAVGLGALAFACVVFGFPYKEAALMGLWWVSLIWAVRRLSVGPGRVVLPRSVYALTQMLLAFDIAFVSVLHGFFGAMPQPTVVAQALSNTNAAEAMNFVQAQTRPIGVALFLAILVLVLGGIARPYVLVPSVPWKQRKRWWQALLVTGLLFVALLHANPTMMRSHPAFRLAVLAYRYERAAQEVEEIKAQRAQVQVHQWSPRLVDTRPSTVVLVIGESSNRENWGVYGYERDTTKALTSTWARLGGEVLLSRQAFSTDAFTLPSLQHALIPHGVWPAGSRGLHGPDIFQLAMGAGYRLSWLSTQPKGEGWFAALASDADFSAFTNSGNWRDSSVQDQSLLPILKQRLSTAGTAHELIVVHTLGQHFFYDQRCPPGQLQFKGVEDGVSLAMRKAGRSSSVIESRNAYDSAVACGADFLAAVVTMANEQAADRLVKVFYFSDHGQEVGHNSDVASHSSVYASGYAIPLWLWSRENLPATWSENLSKPFELTGLSDTLHTVLGMDSSLYNGHRDLLSSQYESPSKLVFNASLTH